VKGAVPLVADELKLKVEFAQTGLLLEPVGADGAVLTSALVVVAVLPQELLIVTV
jgi:hypothetical protein